MMSSLYKKIASLAPVLVVAVLLSAPLLVGAQGSTGGGLSPGGSTGGGLSPGGSTGGNNAFSGPNALQNPLAVDSICGLIALLLKAAIAIGIPIAVLFIVYAGFKFVVARGSPGELSEARANFVATLIGIAIFIGASLIANVIIATLGQLGVNGITACTF